MAPLVRGEDVQSCRQAEANATDERIRKRTPVKRRRTRFKRLRSEGSVPPPSETLSRWPLFLTLTIVVIRVVKTESPNEASHPGRR